MSLYQGSGFWGGKQYQALAGLHLPGPSVVIDVRQGNGYDPSLIWDLAAELEDLTTEMRLNQIYRWRYLSDCIDLLKLTPLRADESERARENTEFRLVTDKGQSILLQGRKALLDNLIEHLDMVRHNRDVAAKDKGNEALGQNPVPANPEQTTVRVFFLVDADDTDSLASAAIYAEWLKKAYHEDQGPGRSGRDRRVSTLVICMNTDPHRHHPDMFAQHMEHRSGMRPAWDGLILLYTYSDDEIYIGGEIQTYLVELILYALLLLSSEGLTMAEQMLVDNQSLSPYVFSDDGAPRATFPWPIYIMGISSLEYSARWAARWLDYGLVATIIGIMYDDREIKQEKILEEIQRGTKKKLQEWQDMVHSAIMSSFTAAMPELQVLDEMEGLILPSPQKRKSSSLQELRALGQRISQMYSGPGSTLENALENAVLIPWQIRRDALQPLTPDADEPAQRDELYQQLRKLESAAAQLPTSLFRDPRGMFPCVQQQVHALTEAIAQLREVAENPPDLLICRKRFVEYAEQELKKLERKRDPFSGKLREEAAKNIRMVAHEHLEQARAVITARVALALLQEVGLDDPDGKPCRYSQRLKRLKEALTSAQKVAAEHRERAYERLQHSLSETQVGVSQESPRYSLNIREDLLPWEQIVEIFVQLRDRLESSPSALRLLGQWLLRVLGSEKPSIIMHQYLREFKERQFIFKAQEQEKEQLYTLSTMLVIILLLLDIVDFDTDSIQLLLDQYIDLMDRSSEEPSVLANNILGLRRIIREARVAQAARNASDKKSQTSFAANFTLQKNQPTERILAAWVSNQCAGDPLLVRILDRSGILERLVENKLQPEQALDDLRERNKLLGYRDDMTGDNRYYLLLAPGEIGDDFLKELDRFSSAPIRPVRFPDAEKLIYLHIHRIHQITPGYFPPSQK